MYVYKLYAHSWSGSYNAYLTHILRFTPEEFEQACIQAAVEVVNIWLNTPASAGCTDECTDGYFSSSLPLSGYDDLAIAIVSRLKDTRGFESLKVEAELTFPAYLNLESVFHSEENGTVEKTNHRAHDALISRFASDGLLSRIHTKHQQLELQDDEALESEQDT